jgi:hypothetical protein
MSVSLEEFTAALIKGSGRAMMMLRQSPGREDLQEALFEACVRNVAYDPQCENERSRYLADLISATGQQRRFFTRLLTTLDAAAGDEDMPDVPQIFDTLARLALDHADLDAEALRQAYADMEDEEDRLDGLDALVRLDGLTAFLRGVETLEAELEERYWRIDGLIEILREREGPGVDVAKLRAGNSALDRLMAHAETEREAISEAQPYDFDDIRAGLRRGVRPHRPFAWLRRLTEAEWSLLAEDLAADTDEKTATIYLRLFARRDFPGDLAPLLRWAEGPSDEASTFHAVMALGRIRAPVVRALALKMIDAGLPLGARLLRSNFEPGDFARLERLLDALSDIDETHDLGLSILEIVSRQERPPEAADILLRLYDRTPCSRCRHDAVDTLAALDAAPQWMAEECRFDAEPETAELFQKAEAPPVENPLPWERAGPAA